MAENNPAAGMGTPGGMTPGQFTTVQRPALMDRRSVSRLAESMATQLKSMQVNLGANDQKTLAVGTASEALTKHLEAFAESTSMVDFMASVDKAGAALDALAKLSQPKAGISAAAPNVAPAAGPSPTATPASMASSHFATSGEPDLLDSGTVEKLLQELQTRATTAQQGTESGHPEATALRDAIEAMQSHLTTMNAPATGPSVYADVGKSLTTLEAALDRLKAVVQRPPSTATPAVTPNVFAVERDEHGNDTTKAFASEPDLHRRIQTGEDTSIPVTATPGGMTPTPPSAIPELMDRSKVAEAQNKLFGMLAAGGGNAKAGTPKTIAVEDAFEALTKHLEAFDAGPLTDLSVTAKAAEEALDRLAKVSQPTATPAPTASPVTPTATPQGSGFPITGNPATGTAPPVTFAGNAPVAAAPKNVPPKTPPTIQPSKSVAAAATGSIRNVLGQGTLATMARLAVSLPGMAKLLAIAPIALSVLSKAIPRFPRVGTKDQDTDTAIQGAKIAGLGQAAMGGAPLGLFNAALLSASRSAGEFGGAVLESRRSLADYNGAIASAFAQLEFQKIGMNIENARATQGSTTALAQSQMGFNREMQPIIQLGMNLINEVGIVATNTAKVYLAAAKMLGVTDKLQAILTILEWFRGKAAKEDDTPPIIAAVRGLAQDLKRPAAMPPGNNQPAVPPMGGLLNDLADRFPWIFNP